MFREIAFILVKTGARARLARVGRGTPASCGEAWWLAATAAVGAASGCVAPQAPGPASVTQAVRSRPARARARGDDAVVHLLCLMPRHIMLRLAV